MAKTLQFRRGTTSELSSVSGSVGELFVNTELDTVVVMDGSTNGGFELTQNAATQTLTNKTLSGAVLTGTLTANGSVGSNGQVLRSIGSMGVEWASINDTNTTYAVSAVDSGDNAIIRLTGSDASTDDVTLVAGSNITITPFGDSITIASTASGGAADLSAVAEDILPAFDEVYDIGSTTNKWYDGFFTNSINLDTISLTSSLGTLAINSDVTVGSLLVDELLLSENTITADASTALQYLGDKGIVEINNSNLDVREGDWIGVPVVESTDVVTPGTTETSVVNTSYSTDNSDFPFSTLSTIDPNPPMSGPYITLDAGTLINPDLVTALSALVSGDQIAVEVEDSTQTRQTYTFTVSGTPTYDGAFNTYTILWSSSSPNYTSVAYNDIVTGITLSETVTTTSADTTTTVPPPTTGVEGLVRYNKDESGLQLYTTEWEKVITTSNISSVNFTGDGSTVGFTINSGRTVDNILVFVNGICLVPTNDYTIDSTTLTFVTAPVANASINIRYLG